MVGFQVVNCKGFKLKKGPFAISYGACRHTFLFIRIAEMQYVWLSGKCLCSLTGKVEVGPLLRPRPSIKIEVGGSLPMNGPGYPSGECIVWTLDDLLMVINILQRSAHQKS